MTKLSSDSLEIIINKKGAELVSVKNKKGLEFMWQADEKVWPRHAPVLFPIVGKLKNDVYSYQGQQYSLSQHGFARDLDFELISNTNAECVFESNATTSTKEKYPFDFVFRIHYSLNKNVLEIKYEVRNPSQQNLLFSVGAHPGFRCPLLPDEKMEDYFLEFEKNEFSQTVLENGLRSAQKQALFLNDKKLELKSSIFDKDALVFENGQISKLCLRSSKSKHAIELTCKDWPFFGIWSKKDCSEFVCLEPWYGIADSTDASGDIKLKKGIIDLAPGAEFTCVYSLQFI